MKTLIRLSVAALLSGGSAFASAGGEASGMSPLVVLLLFFGGLIVTFQLIPAVFLFISMLKGVTSTFRKEAPAAAETGKKS
ncbi:MAG: hypothetical protein IH614_05305 [Desulfuromonadales bacterium]|nr:hypothetical protein [Desulfuromonadales bacterium]